MQRIGSSSASLLLAAGIACAAAISPAAAQRYGGVWEEFRAHTGITPVAAHGTSVLGATDLDGDSIADYVVGAPGAPHGAFVECGVVYAYSGASGALLWFHYGRSDYEHRGAAIALAGDWNSDGVMDIAVGSPDYDPSPLVDAGLLKILDGQTGVDVFTSRGVSSGDHFGASLAGGFDFEADGVPDVLVGAPGSDYAGADSGRCYLIDNSGTKWTYDGPAAGAWCGFDVAWLGDLDGDLLQDFLVGAPNASPGGRFEAGLAIAFSGSTRGTLWAYGGSATQHHLGHAVAGGRDLDGDSVPDFAFSAPGASPRGRAAAGVAAVISGVSGAAVYDCLGETAGDRLGYSLALVEDLDHDGRADLLVGGQRTGGEGLLQVRDGATGRILSRMVGAMIGDGYGASADAIGDVNADSEIDLVVGVPGSDAAGPDAGEALVLTFMPGLVPTVASISAYAGGSVPFTLDFPVAEAGRSYGMLASGSGTGPIVVAGLAIPLTVDPLFMKFRSGAPPSWITGASGTLDASGNAAATVVLPAGSPSSWVGRTIWFAAVSLAAPSRPNLVTTASSILITS